MCFLFSFIILINVPQVCEQKTRAHIHIHGHTREFYVLVSTAFTSRVCHKLIQSNANKCAAHVNMDMDMGCTHVHIYIYVVHTATDLSPSTRNMHFAPSNGNTLCVYIYRCAIYWSGQDQISALSSALQLSRSEISTLLQVIIRCVCVCWQAQQTENNTQVNKHCPGKQVTQEKVHAQVFCSIKWTLTDQFVGLFTTLIKLSLCVCMCVSVCCTRSFSLFSKFHRICVGFHLKNPRFMIGATTKTQILVFEI